MFKIDVCFDIAKYFKSCKAEYILYCYGKWSDIYFRPENICIRWVHQTFDPHEDMIEPFKKCVTQEVSGRGWGGGHKKVTKSDTWGTVCSQKCNVTYLNLFCPFFLQLSILSFLSHEALVILQRARTKNMQKVTCDFFYLR